MAVALVTGASRGIGAACARALAESGHDVGIGYVRDEAGAAETARAVEALGRRALVHRADVADEAEAAGLVAAVEEGLGDLDALVLNAGVIRDGPALRMDAEAWRTVIDTNLGGAFFTARPAMRGMLRRRRGSMSPCRPSWASGATPDRRTTRRPRRASSAWSAPWPASAAPAACGSTRLPQATWRRT